MHNLIPALDARSGSDPTHTQAIKKWTTEILALGEDDVVTVNESSCMDPGCPLIETQLVVFGADGTTRRWKLTRQRYAIARFILEQALAQPPV